MSTTLTNGLKLPDKGSVDWYADMQNNYQILDGAVGTIAEHTAALSGKAPLVHTHTKADITDFPAYGTTAGTICEGNDSRLSDARTPVAHTHTKSDVTDLLNSNFIPSSDMNYTLGSSGLRWKQIWAGGYKAKFNSIDFTDSTTTGSKEFWWVDTMENNETSFFGVGSIRAHSLGLNEEHFRIKNAGGKWADLYIQLGDNNQFTIGTTTHSDVTNNGFRGKFTPLGSFIPYANNSYDLGSSSYQWNNLYAKNYFYNGTAWGLDKANTWSGVNTYTSILQYKWLASGGYSDFRFKDQNDTTQFILRVYSHDVTLAKKSANGSNSFEGSQINFTDGGNLKIQTYDGTNYYIFNFTPTSVHPSSTNTQDLGTSTNKWKTLNGINPGALSLPDVFDSYDVVTTNWNTGYNQPNSLQINGDNPSYPGWLFIRLNNCTEADDFIIVRYYHFDAANITFYGTFLPTDSSYVLTVPIQAGIIIKVWVSKLPTYCKYHACLGTVK